MADRREQILEKAYDMLGEGGLESVHARTVGSALGINHATVHYYFRRRTDLLVGVADFALRRLKADREALGAARSPQGAIENELALAEAYARPNSRMARVILGLLAAASMNPELKAAVGQLWTELGRPGSEAISKAKVRRSSPYHHNDLWTATLFGVMASAHLSGDPVDAPAMLDAVHGSLFKE